MAVIGNAFGELVSRALAGEVIQELRAAIEAEFQAAAKELVDAAVAEAMKSIEVTAHRFMKDCMQDTVGVTIMDRRSKDSAADR